MNEGETGSQGNEVPIEPAGAFNATQRGCGKIILPGILELNCNKFICGGDVVSV